MKLIKAMLLLAMATLYLSACGGGVEGNGNATIDDTTAPHFVTGDPMGSVEQVCSITALFDLPILASTVTDQSFIIKDINSSDPLSSDNGTWGLDPSSATLALFVPSIPLEGSYSVTITTAITSTGGVNLTENSFWTFTARLPCPP
jgi:hypothetical protein